MSADAKQIKTKTIETLSPCIDLHILNLFTTSTLAFTIRQQNGSIPTLYLWKLHFLQWF